MRRLLLGISALTLLVLTGTPAVATHVSCNGQGVPHQYLGGSGADTINGNGSANNMHGQGGDDTLNGNGGGDNVCGGEKQ